MPLYSSCPSNSSAYSRWKQVHYPTAVRDATGITVVQHDGWRFAAPDGQGADGAHEGAAVEVERVSDQLSERQPAMGRAVPEKGFEDLLDALCLLRDRGVRAPHVVLAAVGEGVDLSPYQRRLAGRVAREQLDVSLLTRFCLQVLSLLAHWVCWRTGRSWV